jgi:soluble lytic murein transglycosylase-like protein
MLSVAKLFLILMHIILLLFVLLSPNISYAVIDYEMAQSLKCSRLFSNFEKKYQIPRDTLHSISLQETGKAHPSHKKMIVWPWVINLAGRSLYFNTKAETVYFVKQELKKGKKNIDLGCMQINWMHHGHNFRSVEHALEPRINVHFGAMFLRKKFEQVGNWHKAIAHYHSATPKLGEKYSQSVFKIANNLDANKKAIVQYYTDKNMRHKRSRLN